MSAETVDDLVVTVTIRGTVRGVSGAKQTVNISYERAFSDGTGTRQCGAFFYKDDRSLAATNETLDLDGNTDAFGTSMSDCNNVKMMFAQNNSTTTAEVLTLFGGDFATPMGDATDKIKVGPDGIFLLVSPIDGYAITAGTGDGLLVATSYTGTYDIFLALDNA